MMRACYESPLIDLIHSHQALYCDVRQLLAYIKDVHGGVFRRVLLSGLLDATTRPQQSQDSPPETSRVYR